MIGLGLAGLYIVWLAWRVWRTWPVGSGLLAPALMSVLLSLISSPWRLTPVAPLMACWLGRLDAEVRA